MKNPVRNLLVVGRTWLALRRHAGVFSLADAAMHLNRVLLPDRIHFRAAGRALLIETNITDAGEGAFRIELPRHGLRFYWPNRPTDHLWYLIEQEVDPRNPHHYTTPPIELGPDSLVLDVGACEGLFALRVARQGRTRRVVCFEPEAQMAGLIRRAAHENGVSEKIAVESLAVWRSSGRVGFVAGQSAEGGMVRTGDGGGSEMEAVSLDDYCRAHGLTLTPRDLIKIDAEGADLDVLEGAREAIRSGTPQVAVTTYHADDHVFRIVDWLKTVQPRYRMRLKGFAFWTTPPRPVLLQAAIPATG